MTPASYLESSLDNDPKLAKLIAALQDQTTYRVTKLEVVNKNYGGDYQSLGLDLSIEFDTPDHPVNTEAGQLTPLHFAVWVGYVSKVVWLLANPNYVDNAILGRDFQFLVSNTLEKLRNLSA